MGATDKVADKASDVLNDTAKAGRRFVNRAAAVGDSTADDVRALLKDLEAALKEGKDDDVGALRARIEGRLADARSTLEDVQLSIREKITAAASTTDEYVRDKPLETVGAAAGIAGNLAGFVGNFPGNFAGAVFH